MPRKNRKTLRRRGGLAVAEHARLRVEAQVVVRGARKHAAAPLGAPLHLAGEFLRLHRAAPLAGAVGGTHGAGQGTALCSECHFRLHSTKTAFPGQVLDGTRLVSFAPDVLPADGESAVRWNAKDQSSGTYGTCTLKCHGVNHYGSAY